MALVSRKVLLVLIPTVSPNNSVTDAATQDSQQQKKRLCLNQKSGLFCGSDTQQPLLENYLVLDSPCDHPICVPVCLCLLQVDSSVFDRREMVQSLAFGLSFLQRMDMKPVVVMGSEHEEKELKEPVAKSQSTKGLVERSQQLTEALQQHSATVLPFFSAESFIQLHEGPLGSR